MQVQKGIDCVGVTVSFFCHDGEGNFIMSKRGENARDEQGKWDIGGGAVEVGKTIEETLQDEIRDEYCATILSYEFLGYRDIHRDSDKGKSHWIALDFTVLIDPKGVKNGEPNKFDEIAWFSLTSLPQARLLHSQNPAFFEKYKDKLAVY